MSSNMALSKNN